MHSIIIDSGTNLHLVRSKDSFRDITGKGVKIKGVPLAFAAFLDAVLPGGGSPGVPGLHTDF